MSRNLINPRGDVPTSAITFVETTHGRLRREQRSIDKKDLQSAIKHGSRRSSYPRPNGDPTAVYKYNDIVYVVNERTREEITCYARPLQLDCVPISQAMLLAHERAASRIQRDLSCWTSNTVIVVDTSGSMREGDVWGIRSRLGAVWVSIALDFLAARLESGEAGPTDVLSIITMEEEPRMVVDEEPCTWVLYNKLVSVYSDNDVPARGHGPFLPSLKLAQELLTRNPSASCATSLTFLSDGAPSDYVLGKNATKDEWHRLIVEQVEALSKTFGRRLTFTTIGIGGSEDFRLLERMADSASDYGAKASFMLPSMTSSALGQVFSSVATSLTTTQTEMTDLDTLKQRQVRQVVQESRAKAKQEIQEVSKDDFWIYPRDKVVRLVYNEWYEDQSKKYSFDQAQLQHPSACFVAFSKGAFGEGAERFAYRFYELSDDGKSVVGKALVAKESRMILDAEKLADEQARKKFVRTFCSTQQLARRLAAEFNKKLDDSYRVDPATPRIVFLDCSVYQLDDKNFGTASVLVEERLDHTKWHKWNCNNGFVEGMSKAPEFSQATLRQAFTKVDAEDLGIIEEEEDEEDGEECDDVDDGNANVPSKEPKVFTASEVAQAFSHFSYFASGRKRLVCDLQGVYDEKTRILRLSDPVIHYHNPKRADRSRVHGDTDRGRKGVAMFFETHHEHCGHLCMLVLRGLRPSRRRQDAAR